MFTLPYAVTSNARISPFGMFRSHQELQVLILPGACDTSSGTFTCSSLAQTASNLPGDAGYLSDVVHHKTDASSTHTILFWFVFISAACLLLLPVFYVLQMKLERHLGRLKRLFAHLWLGFTIIAFVSQFASCILSYVLISNKLQPSSKSHVTYGPSMIIMPLLTFLTILYSALGYWRLYDRAIHPTLFGFMKARLCCCWGGIGTSRARSQAQAPVGSGGSQVRFYHQMENGLSGQLDLNRPIDEIPLVNIGRSPTHPQPVVTAADEEEGTHTTSGIPLSPGDLNELRIARRGKWPSRTTTAGPSALPTPPYAGISATSGPLAHPDEFPPVDPDDDGGKGQRRNLSSQVQPGRSSQAKEAAVRGPRHTNFSRRDLNPLGDEEAWVQSTVANPIPSQGGTALAAVQPPRRAVTRRANLETPWRIPRSDEEIVLGDDFRDPYQEAGTQLMSTSTNRASTGPAQAAPPTQPGSPGPYEASFEQGGEAASSRTTIRPRIPRIITTNLQGRVVTPAPKWGGHTPPAEQSSEFSPLPDTTQSRDDDGPSGPSPIVHSNGESSARPLTGRRQT